MSQFSDAMSKFEHRNRSANGTVHSVRHAVLTFALTPLLRKLETDVAASTMERLIEKDRTKARSTFFITGKTRSTTEIAKDLGYEAFCRHRLAANDFRRSTISGGDVKRYDRSTCFNYLAFFEV